MSLSDVVTYCNLALWFGHAVTALMIARKIADLRAEQGTHRSVIGGLVEGQQTLKGRASQIEKQLGRTMRAAGVPGLEQPPEVPVEAQEG